MDKLEDPSSQHPPAQNADLQYILDLFNSEELNLTIAEDTEENQRSSRVSNKKSEDSIDIREEVSDARYRYVFLSFFRKYRQVAITFIDAAIRFMNAIKKMKMEDLVKQLSEQQTMPAIMDSLICPELLIEPIEDELAYCQLSENDVVRYGEALSILKGNKNLTKQQKDRIRVLLSQIEAH